jgi:hypothetical protein
VVSHVFALDEPTFVGVVLFLLIVGQLIKQHIPLRLFTKRRLHSPTSRRRMRKARDRRLVNSQAPTDQASTECDGGNGQPASTKRSDP